MPRLFLLLLLFITSKFAHAQRHDNHFVFGGGTQGAPKRKNDMHFTNGKLQVDTFTLPFRYMMARTVGTISDSAGRLQFFTNGCELINRKNRIMLRGDSLNPGASYNWTCKQYGGFDLMRGTVILPRPGHSSQYVMVHLNNKKRQRYPDQLLHTTVDMTLDSGLGAVTQKNRIAAEMPFADLLTATRHANGRDWWFLIPKRDTGLTNTYYTFLLDPQGLHFKDSTSIGRKDMMQFATQAAFSPDGSLFARMNVWQGVVLLLGFDRCTGALCCPQEIKVKKGEVCGSLCFSPNQRFLYISSCTSLSQYDVLKGGGSAMFIDTFDGFSTPFVTAFFQQWLAPDGKIYMGTTSSAQHLHIVHNPDSLGKACNFRQHDYRIYSELNIGMPNFPNFALKNLLGSPCDTLYKAPPKPDSDCSTCKTVIKIKPNPVQEQVDVETAACVQADLRVYDVLGRLLMTHKTDPSGKTTMEVQGFMPGVYFIEARRPGGHCVIQMVVGK